MPEPDEIDTFPSGEPPPSGKPPPENENNLATQPDSAAQPVAVESGDTESDPSPLAAQPAEGESTLAATDQKQAIEPPAVVEDDSLWAESQLEPAEPPDELKPAFPEPRRLSRGERETVDRVRQRFGACGRCGYFIADCQNQLGVEAVQTALLDTADGWVNLTVDRSFHRRVMDAYGVELDAEFDSFDGTCPECRRRFVVKNDDDGLTYLKIRV